MAKISPESGTAENTGPGASGPAPVPTPEESGRLVLASGAIVAVPAESVAVSTEHYDQALGVTVPVVSRFVLPDPRV